MTALGNRGRWSGDRFWGAKSPLPGADADGS